MIEILNGICLLALIIVLAGCGMSPRRGKGTRLRDAPWVIVYGNGDFEVDMNHPEWQKKFNEQLKKDK